METKRQQQLAQDIQRVVGNGFSNEIKDLLVGAFATVADVKLTPDLMTATIYLTVFEKQKEETVINSLKENTSKVRRLVGNQLRNKVRRIPELEFFIDHSLEKVFEIETLLRDSKQNQEEE